MKLKRVEDNGHVMVALDLEVTAEDIASAVPEAEGEDHLFVRALRRELHDEPNLKITGDGEEVCLCRVDDHGDFVSNVAVLVIYDEAETLLEDFDEGKPVIPRIVELGVLDNEVVTWETLGAVW